VVCYWIDVDHQLDIIVLNGILNEILKSETAKLPCDEYLNNLKVSYANSQYKLDLLLLHIQSVTERLHNAEVAVIIDSFSDLYEKSEPIQNNFEKVISDTANKYVFFVMNFFT